MLDDVTKKRINTLRQILVGKLPDPKAQVEQITNGLIYKFMNDMDEQSVSMGGKSTYFSGKFQKYSWKNLMDTKTSGVEKIKLYSEAIEQMYTNENLPELFREIFKNSFLPFKDPSTLNMFLKEINEFHYSNSERLGDAFEYLLSFMGSQGDAGQFRTPRHIIDFIVEIVNPLKNETILDPACGTAGFLISSYKHILNQNTKKNLGDGLTASDRKKIGNNLNGYDISPDMVKMSLVNMYLHKFTNPKINEYDTLSSEDRWNEYYDVIFANPPFFSPRGGIIPHNRFGVKSTKAEILFIDYINEHLKPNGRAGIIVPEGVIFQTGTSYKQLRKRLIETSLIGVISLPSGIFNPYAGVKTSILILNKSFNKKTDNIFFYKVNNDGYSLGAQRNKQDSNDIPECISLFQKFLKQETGKDTINKKKINSENDFTYAYDKIVLKQTNNSKYEFKNLSEIADFVRGVTFSKNDRLDKETDNSVKIATTRASQDDEIKEKHLNIVDKKFVKNEDQFLKKNDLLISLANSLHLVGRITFINKSYYRTSFGAFMGCIRAKNKMINPILLNYFLKSSYAKEFFKSNANTTTNISNLNFKTIGKLKLPVPQIETQNQIVEELDGYQKIVDGCRQIIENYKLSIDIDASWEMIEIGQLILSSKLGLVRSAKDQNDSQRISYIKMNNITYKGDLDLNKVVKVKANEDELKNYNIKKGDILFNTRNTPELVGKCCVVERDLINTTFNNNLLRLRLKENYLPEFLNIVLNQDIYKKELKRFVDATTSVAAIYQKNLFSIRVPIPNLDTQKDIVNNIQKERESINKNKDLKNYYSDKINKKVNKYFSN